MKTVRIILSVLLILFHSSCEKVLDINLNDSDPKLVIEGIVTNQSAPQVIKISRSIPISDSNIFPGVSNAEVTVTDNAGRVFIFTEQSPGIYVNSTLKGQPARIYKLKVVSDGNEYTATSTMPSQVNIDLLRLTETTFFKREIKSVDVFYIDPLFDTNYYRFILSINGVPSKNIYVYKDDFDQGKIVYKELQDPDNDLVSGDVVEVEMECIDKNIYRYWYGLNENKTNGGILTIPANPVSNISNKALGYFSAHTVHRKSIIVP
jgi:hypothetical protein